MNSPSRDRWMILQICLLLLLSSLLLSLQCPSFLPVLPISAQSCPSSPSSYISVLLDSHNCPEVDSMTVDEDGVIYAVCDNGIVSLNGTTLTTLYNTTSCYSPGGRSHGAIVVDSSSGTVYASCLGHGGIFAIDKMGQARNVTSSSTCYFASSLVISQDFLFAGCDMNGILRFNMKDWTFDLIMPPSLCMNPSRVVHFSENNQEYLLAACFQAGIYQVNLADQSSILTLANQTQCVQAMDVARDSDSGIIFGACMQAGAIQINGTEVTPIALWSDCFFVTHIWLDRRSKFQYFACPSAQQATLIAKFNDAITPIVAPSQCTTASDLFIVNGGLLVLCYGDSALHISSSTLSQSVAYSSLYVLTEMLVDSSAGTFIARADSSLISVKNNIVTVLADSTECSSGYGLAFRNEDIVASCFTSLLFINRFNHNRTTVSVGQPCPYLNGFYADPSSDLLLIGCEQGGLFAYNLTTHNSTQLVEFQEYGPCFYFQKDVATNSVFISCPSFGVLKYHITTSHVSVVANLSTDCAITGVLAISNHGMLYANCYDKVSNSQILVFNDTSMTRLTVNPSCDKLSIIGSSTATNTIITFCSDFAAGGQQGMVTMTIDMLSHASTIITTVDQCSTATSAYQDPMSLAIWIACSQPGAMVASSDFRCQPGAAWNFGQCMPCALGSSRTFASVEPLSQCMPCSSGYVSTGAGAASCDPCPAGSFESSNNCVSCSAGRYQQSPAASSCLPCEGGSYSFQPGRTVCDQCNPGFFSVGNGSTSCTPCDRGSASSVIGLDRPCDGCQAGRYQAGIGQSECLECEPQFYNEQANSTSCTRCANKVNADHTTCTLVICDSNSQFNEFTQSCELCPLSQFSNQGGKCSTCLFNSYTPGPGSGCAPCDASGLICSGGLVAVEQNYWAFPSPTRNWTVYTTDGSGSNLVLTWPMYDTVACPFCPGSPLQVLQANSSDIVYCTFPRLNSADNTLCARCDPDHLAWGSSCVKCDEANIGLIFGYLILSFSIVTFLLYSATSTSSAGALSAFLFFTQTASLELGPVVSFIDWIEITNMSLKSTSSCIAPWSAHQQTLFTILIPFFLLAELFLMAIVHHGFRAIMLKCEKLKVDEELTSSFQLEESNPAQSLSEALVEVPGVKDDRIASADPSHLSTRLSVFIRSLLLRFSWSKYRAGGMAILLFCYSQVTVACLRYLYCIDVGNEKLNFNAPTIDCRSSEYQHYLVPVLIALVVYVIGFPCFTFLFLWRKRKELFAETKESHSAGGNNIISSNRAREVEPESDQISDPSVIDTWFPYYRMYRRTVWWWQSWVLLRRGCSVVLAVLLTQQPSQRFMLFSFLHLVSLLSHAFAKPYKSERLNQIETASYVLLICISQLLTGFLPPSYPLYVQIALFLFIVPPAMAMFAFVVWQRYQLWKSNNKTKKPQVRQNQDNVLEDENELLDENDCPVATQDL